MDKVWTRKEAESNLAELLDSARGAPQTVLEHDGKFIVRFEPGVRMPVSEWSLRPGTLEEDDVL